MGIIGQNFRRYLRRSPWLWVSLILLNACGGSTASDEVLSPTANDATNCPQTDPEAQQFTIKADLSVAEQFDFMAWDIQADADTVMVQTKQHQLIFCRETQAWAILPPAVFTPDQEPDLERLRTGEDPAFQTLELAGKTYQYRVFLRPNPFLSFENPPEKTIFELIPPGETEAIALDLYTLEQLRASGIGNDLGIPAVTAALPVGNALFFAVSSEQGEGFSGLSTFIRYDLTTNSLELHQPPEAIATQITDLQGITTDSETILWFGTKYAAEGSRQIPARGLGVYEFTNDWRQGELTFYTITDSPLVGAIPTQLHAEEDLLWVATGNGICQIQWREIQQWDAWDCWWFALETQLPPSGVPVYRSLLAPTPSATLTETTAEVLWWANTVPLGIDGQPKQGRYEIAYSPGFRVTVPEGAFRWEKGIYWPGEEWHWAGDRFTRAFDEVQENAVGLGPVGISEQGYTAEGVQDTNVLRGDFQLFTLTQDVTIVDYFSGWVEAEAIAPYFTLTPSTKTPITTENPLQKITTELF
ncbi:hypothetical protein NIES970_18160 [[Synechococcus] sp. NIES-970]|nr:hypothetical protein NIES970_18160 [[Synechococcus] sp. NIES-970]